jgi:hypothetical protein
MNSLSFMSNFQANLIDSKMQNRQQAEEKEAKKDEGEKESEKMTKMRRNLCCQESLSKLGRLLSFQPVPGFQS